jgi:hypothetical protein
MALARLGAARITALTDNTAEAKLCNLLFDETADLVMVEGSWATTIKRASLNATTNTPAYGFTTEFQLPTDPFCLKVLQINDITPGDEEYRIEGDKLLANISTMKVKYIGRLTDTQAYGPFLTQAIITRLTAELAYPITGQASVADRWFQQYERDVQKGLANDGQQGSNELTVSPDLTDVR